MAPAFRQGSRKSAPRGGRRLIKPHGKLAAGSSHSAPVGIPLPGGGRHHLDRLQPGTHLAVPHPALEPSGIALRFAASARGSWHAVRMISFTILLYNAPPCAAPFNLRGSPKGRDSRWIVGKPEVMSEVDQSYNRIYEIGCSLVNPCF